MYYAVCAGVFGALASVASKLTMNGDAILLRYMQPSIHVDIQHVQYILYHIHASPLTENGRHIMQRVHYRLL